jgi:predicted dehydrogenase
MLDPLTLTKRPATTRRDFLRTSAALAGTAVLGELAISRSAHAAGSDMIKIGLVGCGERGSGAAINAMNAGKDVQLVAMADLFRDQLDKSLKGLKTQKPDQVVVKDDHCFTGFDAYKELIASSVDAVLIAPTSGFIPRILKAVIDAGKHAFCEKPHGLDVPGVKTVEGACELAKQKKLSVVSGLCWRYSNVVRETMKRIHDGQIGEIVAVQENYASAPYGLHERLPEWSEMEFQLRNWYHFNYLSGDQTLQQLIHSIDKGSWVLGDKPPLRAWGMGGRQVCTELKYGDQYDHQCVVFEYPNGVRMFGFTRDMPDCWRQTSDYIIGTEGRCTLIDGLIEGEKPWKFEGQKNNMTDAEQAALMDSIRNGEPINSGHYMCLSTLLGIVAQMASYSGQMIEWDKAMQSKRVLTPPDLSLTSEPPVKPGPGNIYPAPMPGKVELEKWLM